MDIDPSSHVGVTKQVPAEIWLKVFGYLSYKDLLMSTEVCHSWNDIISSSQQFISKTKLCIYGTHGTQDIAVATFKITRSSYESLWLGFTLSTLKPTENRQLLSQLLPTAPRLRYMCIVGEFFGADIIDFLHHCGRLKDIEMNGCEFVRSYDMMSPVELNLDDLYVSNSGASDDWILDHLHCRSVKKSLQYIECQNNDFCEIVRFLNKVEGEVESLILKGADLGKTSVVFSPKFKWRTLEINDSNVDTMFAQTMPNKQKLFDAALPNATLKLDWFDRGNPQVFNAIANAKNVTSLFMNSELFDGILTQDQADALPDIDHVEFLSIESLETTTRSDLSLYLEPFLNKLAKLNTLVMDVILLKFLSTDIVQPYQLNLKSLHLWSHDIGSYVGANSVRFLQRMFLPNIKTLKLSDLTSRELLSFGFVQVLATFGQNNPSLKELRIIHHFDQLFEHPSEAERLCQEILLNVFAAMPRVQVIEIIRWEDGPYYGGTRAEIYEKYFGNEEAACATLTMMRRDR